MQPGIRPNIALTPARASIQPAGLKPQLRPFFPSSIQRMQTELSTFRAAEGTPLARLSPKIREVRSSQVTEQGFFRSLTGKQKADALFKEFLALGVGYNLGSSSPTLLLGMGVQPLAPGEPMRRGFDGNCLAMANALAHIFSEAGVSAEAKEVRAEKPGKAFVVHAPNFVDKMVTGHIFKETVLWQNRYLFTNHTATWVPTLNIYYDLMAGTTYQSLDQHIEMELTATDASGDAFEGSYQARVWQLVRRTDIRGPGGGFFRFDMTPKAP